MNGITNQFPTSNPDSLDLENSFQRILITGGCGFIGLNLIKYLAKRGCVSMCVLDNLDVGRKEYLEELLSEQGNLATREMGGKIRYSVVLNREGGSSPHSLTTEPLTLELVTGDLRDKQTCHKATEDINTVVHLAAHAGVVPSVEDPFFDFEVNALGTLNLLDASVKKGVEKFVLASSNAPIGNQAPPMDENKPPKPLSPYGASKLACEGYCSAFHGSYGLKTISLRFSNAYGPYSLHKNSVIAKFIKDAMIKGGLTIYGDGTQTRDFIHVDDICQAIFLVLTAEHRASDDSTATSIKVWGETFHLGTGKETRIIDLAETVRRLSGDEIQLVHEPPRSGEIKRNYSDISKARTALGFVPQINLTDGMKSVYEWFKEQGADNIKNAHVLSGSE